MRTPRRGHDAPLYNIYIVGVLYIDGLPQKKNEYGEGSPSSKERGQVKNRNFTSTTWPDFKQTATVMKLRIVQGLKDTQKLVCTV
jgi:hypothetical protein